MLTFTIWLINCFDFVTTLFLYNRYGLGIEINPFGAFFITHPFGQFLKIAGVSTLLMILHFYNEDGNQIARISVIALFIVFVLLFFYEIVILSVVNFIDPF